MKIDDKIQRTANTVFFSLGDVKVNHRGIDAFVPQQIFIGQNVQPLFQQVGGIGMPERMDVHRLENTGFQIGLQSTDKNISQRNVAVFLSFAILYMKYLSLKIKIGNLQVPDLKAAESTAVKQGYQDAVFEKFGSFKESTDLFLN